jgi:hypothetical protein
MRTRAPVNPSAPIAFGTGARIQKASVTVDPQTAQALVVRRAPGRDLEAALDDAPLLEPSSSAQHVIR